MTEAEIAALLGRPLTATESANFQLYLDIATEQLEELLCYPIDCKPGNRTFLGRDGYSTVFTGAFRNLSAVEVNGESIETVKPQLWDNPNAKWYNSVVFKDQLGCDDEVTVYADWGFKTLPADLMQVLAGLFGLVSRKQEQAINGNIASKRVEDFAITYQNESVVDPTTLFQRFSSENAAVINKYSLCNVAGQIEHGDTRTRLQYHANVFYKTDKVFE